MLEFLGLPGVGRLLEVDFERALLETKLPERPDYEVANGFLIKARHSQLN